MQNTAAIRCVLFDVDGTLVSSNDEHAQSWVDAFAEFGKPYTFSAVRPLIGMGTDKLLKALGADIQVDSDLGTALTSRRKAIFLDRHLQNVVGFPGSRELILVFKRFDMKCVVASSASSEELGPLLATAELSADLFDRVVSPDEVRATKPDADVILAALAWSKTRPEQTVMIGDTSYDVEAAHRAGVRCIGLRAGGALNNSLADADAIFDSPRALLTVLQTTPLDTLLYARKSVDAREHSPAYPERYPYVDGRVALDAQL